MFVLKKKYFFIIGSIKDIDLNNIKKYNKFSIIYRNKKTPEDLNSLLIFRKKCRLKNIKFYIANNTRAITPIKHNTITYKNVFVESEAFSYIFGCLYFDLLWISLYLSSATFEIGLSDVDLLSSLLPQCLQTVASSLTSSAQ